MLEGVVSYRPPTPTPPTLSPSKIGSNIEVGLKKSWSKNLKRRKKMANFIFLLEKNKTKQVSSNLFHPPYLRRYKKFNFHFYSEILINLYDKTLFL